MTGFRLRKLLLATSLAVLVAGCGPSGPRVSPQETAHLTEEFVVACTMVKPALAGASREVIVDLCRCTHREAAKRFGVRELHTGILGGEGPKLVDLAQEVTTCREELRQAGNWR
jgi:hypothetical protein